MWSKAWAKGDVHQFSPSLIEEARIKMSVIIEKEIAAKASRLPHLSSTCIENDEDDYMISIMILMMIWQKIPHLSSA